MIYWSHRLFHILPVLRKIHYIHHKHVIDKTGSLKWKWSNVFIWVDGWKGTVDQWALEVIPTIIFCFIFDQWWLLIFYWLWTAFIQERIEHNEKFDIYPFLTSGKWHLIHHVNDCKNYGVFFPIWDILFKTHQK
jgi:sterol desaturase/sphingolipid hydroxylase (fatty acid hydroxylase superfamily)